MKRMMRTLVLLFCGLLLACSDQSQTVGSSALVTTTSCLSQLNDSHLNPDGSISFNYSAYGTYHRIAAVRQSMAGEDVGIDYIVYEPAGVPKGVILYIAGGHA